MAQGRNQRQGGGKGAGGGLVWASKRRWRAAICFKGRRYYLGSYSRFEDAVKARKRAEEELHDGFLREYARQAASL